MAKKIKLKGQDRMAKARAVRMENLQRAKAAREASAMAIDATTEAMEEDDAPVRITRQPLRRNPRETAPGNTGRISVRGRDGEVLSRTRTFTHDQFEIPENMIPKGWTYQWNTISVHGNQEIAGNYTLMMAQNGWRPVPAERYAGTLLPKGAKGSIIRDGQRLEERPLELTLEAKAEDVRNAKQLISDRNESLKLTQTKKQLGPGFEMSKRYRGTGGDIRMHMDASLDAEIPRPQHQLANDDE